MEISVAKKKFRSPPRTAMEVFEILPEGTLAEVINNVLYMSPAPTYEHQKMLANLFYTLKEYVDKYDLGDCVFSPVDVYLGDKSAVQPDIIFIAKENLNIIQSGKVKGPPDLIVEVMSGNKKHDLQRKKFLYEAFGVKEYFIIDQLNREVISYYFDGEKFILQKSKKGKIKSKLLKKVFLF